MFSNRTKLRCVKRIQKICNYLGSFCNAEIISKRKKRSLNFGLLFKTQKIKYLDKQ